jgi:hypothetical protein
MISFFNVYSEEKSFEGQGGRRFKDQHEKKKTKITVGKTWCLGHDCQMCITT